MCIRLASESPVQHTNKIERNREKTEGANEEKEAKNKQNSLAFVRARCIANLKKEHDKAEKNKIQRK
jgi:hypothetical protein